MRTLIRYAILLLFVSFFVTPVSAQTPRPAMRWVCLNAQICTATGAGCSGPVGAWGHRVKISSKADSKPLPNADTYLIECLPISSTQQVCTTGNATLDKEALNNPPGYDLATLESVLKYKFEGLFAGELKTASPKVKSSSTGVVGPYEWQSFTPGGAARKFMAVNLYDPKTVTIEDPKGQQQGTFTFDEASKNCLSIAWDPYGRVFDSLSLEPIPGAIVDLWERKSGGEFTSVQNMLGVVNPQTTVENGEFSFVVPDNSYLLKVSAPGYKVLRPSPTINPSYSSIYSDIYRGEQIVQQAGTAQHRDVPLEPASGTGITYPLKVEVFQEVNKATGKVILDGTASHPFTKIKVYSIKVNPDNPDIKVRGSLIKTAQSDKLGKFKVEVEAKTLGVNEVFGEVEYEKSDLSLLSSILDRFFQVEAQESTVSRYEPIPNYIEGYAYDSTSNTLSGATVGVYLSFAGNPYYETKADEKGYFRVSSEYLPTMPYKLVYQSPSGSRVNVSTSKFIAQNATFLKNNKVDLYTFKDTTGKTLSQANPSTAPTGFKTGSSQLGNGQGTGSQGAETVSPTQSGMLLIIVIVLVLLGVAGLLLAVYLYNKNRSSQLPPQL